MLTYEDCLALADLREDEVAAIAEHEHVPEMIALEIGHYVCERPDGSRWVEQVIVDDIDAARRVGNLAHAAKLRLVLAHFCATHPRSVDA